LIIFELLILDADLYQYSLVGGDYYEFD